MKREDIEVGQIVYTIEYGNCYSRKPQIKVGIVDFYSCTDVCIDFIVVKDNRIVVDLDGKKTPFEKFQNDMEYRKLPKGWTYNTELYHIEYSPLDSSLMKIKVGDVKNVKKLYDKGVLVKDSLIRYEHIESFVDKNGYKLVRKLEPWKQYHLGTTLTFDKVYATLEEAQNVIDAYEAEMRRQTELTDAEWSFEKIINTLNRYKTIYNISEECYNDYVEFFERQNHIEDIEVRIYSGTIQWKLWKNKKWNTL